MSDYLAKLHHSVDLGMTTITPTAGSLDGSHAVLRVGRVGKIGTPEALRCLLDSDEPPDEPAVFSWSEADGDDGSWTLSTKLSKAIVDAIGVGGWTYELSIVGSNDEPMWGEAGTIRIAPSLPEDFDL